MATGDFTATQEQNVYAETLVVGVAGSQKTITGTEIGQIDGVTAGTAAASKALVLDANKDASGVRNLGLTKVEFAAGGSVKVDGGTGTCTSNAVTISKMAGVITTESLSTAAGASQAITLTNTLIAAGDIVQVSFVSVPANGTAVLAAVAGAGAATITIYNKHASAAFNGAFTIAFNVLKTA